MMVDDSKEIVGGSAVVSSFFFYSLIFSKLQIAEWKFDGGVVLWTLHGFCATVPYIAIEAPKMSDKDVRRFDDLEGFLHSDGRALAASGVVHSLGLCVVLKSFFFQNSWYTIPQCMLQVSADSDGELL